MTKREQTYRCKFCGVRLFISAEVHYKLEPYCADQAQEADSDVKTNTSAQIATNPRSLQVGDPRASETKALK